MPVMETIAIVNKSGKLISSSKHFVNIFKDAKDAYQERKLELQAEHRQKEKDRSARRLKAARIDVDDQRSVAGSSRSRRHRRERDDRDHVAVQQLEHPRRPMLPERHTSHEDTASVTSSRHGSRRGSRAGTERGGVRSPQQNPAFYQAPYFETQVDLARPDLTRRHTDFPLQPVVEQLPMLPRRPSGGSFGQPQRSMSSPLIEHEEIDMHLAYGELPLQSSPPEAAKEQELQGLMSKLDTLMLEAQCVQHSATTIMSSLQANPEAMAAVALTLAELSKLLTKMSPGILSAIKAGSPAIFALLCSPQFLIAGGVAVGVTIVMFGGYKIIKKIQNEHAASKEAGRMDEALAFEGGVPYETGMGGEYEPGHDGNFDGDLGSIETWRRGIAEVEAQSVATSVDGEFITPAAERMRKERISDRAKEERSSRGDVRSSKSRKAPSMAGSQASTIRKKDVVPNASNRRVENDGMTTVSDRLERLEVTAPKAPKSIKEKKVKKTNALAVLFRKKEKSGKEKELVLNHRPRILEMK